MTRTAEASRAGVVSSFTLIKGALIPESYSALAAWDLGRSKEENLRQFKEQNLVGARSGTWLRDVAFVLSRRFDPAGRDRPLTILAKAGVPLEEWTPLLLWHITRDEFLLRDFLTDWLFTAWEVGTFRVRPEDLFEYLPRLKERGGRTEHAWKEHTTKRVAAGLLKVAVDFGLLKGTSVKEFASYHLPEASFLYLLHAMLEQHLNPAKVVECPDWRLYLMRRDDVERELLRLHQYRRLEYHVAGSLTQLTLPCASTLEYAEKWGA